MTPLNWIFHKNYAIYDIHPIFFSETSIRHWRFDDRKKKPWNLIIIKIYTFEYYVKFSFWVSVYKRIKKPYSYVSFTPPPPPPPHISQRLPPPPPCINTYIVTRGSDIRPYGLLWLDQGRYITKWYIISCGSIVFWHNIPRHKRSVMSKRSCTYNQTNAARSERSAKNAQSDCWSYRFAHWLHQAIHFMKEKIIRYQNQRSRIQ